MVVWNSKKSPQWLIKRPYVSTFNYQHRGAMKSFPGLGVAVNFILNLMPGFRTVFHNFFVSNFVVSSSIFNGIRID